MRRRVLAGARPQQTPASGRAGRWRRRAQTARPGWAWATILALAASGLVAVAIQQASRSSAREERGLISTSLGGAHAVLRRSGSATELSLTGMPLPPADETYEIWLLDGHGSLRALGDMFTVTRAGHATVALPGDLGRVRELILTREPIGGSDAPKGPPLLEILNPGTLADRTT